MIALSVKENAKSSDAGSEEKSEYTYMLSSIEIVSYDIHEKG